MNNMIAVRQTRRVLMPLPLPALPGFVSLRRYAYFQGLGAVGYAVSKVRRLRPSDAAADALSIRGFRLQVERLRRRIGGRVLSAVPGSPGPCSDSRWPCLRMRHNYNDDLNRYAGAVMQRSPLYLHELHAQFLRCEGACTFMPISSDCRTGLKPWSTTAFPQPRIRLKYRVDK